MSKLAKYLNRQLVGNVFDRPTICAKYAQDRSILQISPRLVAFPETTNDLRKIVHFSNQLALRDFILPLTVRGTGLDKTGAAIGDGLVISMERMNHIEEIDVRGRLVRAQPGVTLGRLNAALALQGLCLPINYDPRSTIGGLIANCPNDAASDRHGGIFHFIERAEVILASGDAVQLAPYNLRVAALKAELDSFEGTLYRQMNDLLNRFGDTIMDRSMRPFDTAGYANITRVKNARNLNLLPLMFASQGTLGIISDIILRVEVLPRTPRHLVVVVEDLKIMLRFMNYVRELEPSEAQIYDQRVIQIATNQGNPPELLEATANKGWVAVIGFDDRRHRLNRKIEQCREILPVGSLVIEENLENSDDFREFQSALLSFLNSDLNGQRLAVADDVYIPSYKFTEFVEGLKTIEEILQLDLPLYGSFATSNYTVRPELDYRDVDGRKKAVEFLRQYSRLVVDCEGSLTGGSPEGRIKALTALQNLTDNERELYLAIKAAFDPHNILNPNVKLGAEVRDTVRHLINQDQEGVITP